MFYLGCHRSEMSLFYRYSCKYLRVVSLLVKLVLCCLFFAWGFWRMCKTFAVNVHLRSCFQEKSKVFDFWMPIVMGHQLLCLYLKAEMFHVALCPDCWPGGQTTLSALSWQWPAGCLGSCNNHALTSLQVMAAKDNYLMTNCVACL